MTQIKALNRLKRYSGYNEIMKTEFPSETNKIMDVRGIPCSIKHGRIMQRFLDLQVGDYFVLVNDHDPIRLREQFSMYWPAAFSWSYVAQGPEEIQVKIGKIAAVGEDCANLGQPMTT